MINLFLGCCRDLSQYVKDVGPPVLGRLGIRFSSLRRSRNSIFSQVTTPKEEMKEESTLPKSTSPLTSPNSEEGCRALPTTALPPMLDTTPVPPPIRKDSVSDGKTTSTFKPIGSMSILDVKYFPKAGYQCSTTTTPSERQREILGSVKGKGLSEIRRKSIDDDLVKPETPDPSCSTESRRYAKCRRLHLRLRNPPSRTLSPVLGAMHLEPPTLDYTHLPEIGETLSSTPKRSNH